VQKFFKGNIICDQIVICDLVTYGELFPFA